MSTWGKRFKGRMPQPAPRTDGSWWAQLPGESLTDWRERFQVERVRLEPVLSQSRFGQILGKPFTAPDTVTTVQRKRWELGRTEQAS